jgi:hypothetical protein
VKALVGIVGVGAMFAALLRRHIACCLSVRVACSIVKDLLGDILPELMSRVSFVARSRKYVIKEGLLTRKQV